MNEFLDHVKEGLSQNPKKLSSRYFYDEKGDALFQQIMQLEEYYLPAYEMQIIHQKSLDIASDIAPGHKDLQVIELGAGDGSKTKYLLEQFYPLFDSLAYVALDISPNILEENKKQIEKHNPDLKQNSVAGNYFETYKQLPETSRSRLVLFLGANIGNFLTNAAIDFFQFVKSGLKPNDCFLVAFDLVKHPRKIIKAYDDSKGVTKAFNINLLERINRELGADFDITKFDHFPFYDPLRGITSSQIISLEAQEVTLPDGFSATFAPYEAIHTEVSKKFFMSDIEEIADKTAMKIMHTYYNENKEYVFVLFEK